MHRGLSAGIVSTIPSNSRCKVRIDFLSQTHASVCGHVFCYRLTSKLRCRADYFAFGTLLVWLMRDMEYEMWPWRQRNSRQISLRRLRFGHRNLASCWIYFPGFNHVRSSQSPLLYGTTRTIEKPMPELIDRVSRMICSHLLSKQATLT